MVPAPLNPSRLKQMKAEQNGGDPLAAVPPSTDAYPKKRSRRRSIGKKPENNTETLVQQPAQGSREHRRSRDISYAASEIYEPDWALSPFPSNIVGTFSCHGIEPSYFTNGAMAKINQDRGCVVQPYGEDPRRALFAVYDGHGEHGQEVSQFAMEYIRDNLHKHPSFSSDLPAALKTTFLACDLAMKKDPTVRCKHSGTTAVVAVLVDKTLTLASAGDSRAVLATKKGSKIIAKDLTVDHNPDVPEEQARIEAAGGFVKPRTKEGFSARGELNANFTQVGFARSRSLGDRGVKHVGVIADPAISTYTLTENDVFFIVASDGIWEFIESKNAVDLCKDLVQKDDATGACRELILEAAAKWNEEEGDYRDDITCMVVRVNPLDHAAADLAYLPAAADELEHQAGNRQRTTNRKVGSGKKTVLLDTKGAGTIDTAGVDTTGDGTADTFYPAEKVDGNVIIHTDRARKASNFIGGNKGGTQQQKKAFADKQKQLAALAAKVDASVEPNDGESYEDD